MDRKKPWLCPECGSDNIYHASGALTDNPRGVSRNFLQITFGPISEALGLDVYVCGNCGAVRTFVAEEEGLQKISEKWEKLNEQGD